MILATRIEFATTASRVASAGRCNRARSCLGAGGGSIAWLLLEKITPSVLVRSGNLAAKICAIMPPIDPPTMWARSMPRWSSSAAASSAMSSSV